MGVESIQERYQEEIKKYRRGMENVKSRHIHHLKARLKTIREKQNQTDEKDKELFAMP